MNKQEKRLKKRKEHEKKRKAILSLKREVKEHNKERSREIPGLPGSYPYQLSPRFDVDIHANKVHNKIMEVENAAGQRKQERKKQKFVDYITAKGVTKLKVKEVSIHYKLDNGDTITRHINIPDIIAVEPGEIYDRIGIANKAVTEAVVINLQFKKEGGENIMVDEPKIEGEADKAPEAPVEPQAPVQPAAPEVPAEPAKAEESAPAEPAAPAEGEKLPDGVEQV